MPSRVFQLHVITDHLRAAGTWLPRVLAAAASGVDWVQVRDKAAAASDMLDLTLELRALLAASSEAGAVRVSVNDRLDVALAAAADGVHLAGKSLPVRAAREVSSGRLLVGRSVHGLDESMRAAADGADYLTYGHIFPSSSKVGLPPRGLDELARIVQVVDVPVLAIGGITAENVHQVLATGCAGIAVISAILSSPEPARAAAELRAALDTSPYCPRRSFPSLAFGGAHASHRQPTAL